MQFLSRIITRNLQSSPSLRSNLLAIPRFFSTGGDGGGHFVWDDSSTSTWSTGLTKDQIDGEAVGHQVTPPPPSTGDGGGIIGGGGAIESLPSSMSWMQQKQAKMERDSRGFNEVINNWEARELETHKLLKQVYETGVRGSYLKDSEKTEMYKKYKENPEEYTVEKLAEEYRILQQRVEAILWLKEDEEDEAKRRGEPLDDAVELLLDNFPHFFNSHDREYHVATLPYKPDFKVMPEGWDGTTKDRDEVHYERSKKEDDALYREFKLRFEFNKMKFKKQVKVHKYSRRRPSNGWEFIVEMKRFRGKRGDGRGWKFASLPDGSTRPLNKIEKMYARRETPRGRWKLRPWTCSNSFFPPKCTLT
ncbi:protein GAMETE CELL DEFECTIVE 1, mitochondrial [Silene latifolia]|uniref:protein GAMETE CELL DEFECTIVE 1, mitochondrial n=1 Tax=Silene latifolia TaxID=37657 RepID=UPI003D781CA8